MPRAMTRPRQRSVRRASRAGATATSAYSFRTLAGGAGVGGRAGAMPASARAVRAVGRAAQPVRPGDAGPARRAAAAGMGMAGARPGLPARHRRPGPRRALGDHVRRAHLAAGRRSPRCCFAMVLGVALGLLAGYVGGRVDAFIMRICDVHAVVSRDPDRAADRRRRARGASARTRTTARAFGAHPRHRAAGWVQYARTVRGSTLVERNKEYVQAARVIGVPPLRIMLHHVLPNVMGPVLVLRRSTSRRRSSPRRRCRSSASACRRPRRRSAP